MKAEDFLMIEKITTKIKNKIDSFSNLKNNFRLKYKNTIDAVLDPGFVLVSGLGLTYKCAELIANTIPSLSQYQQNMLFAGITTTAMIALYNGKKIFSLIKKPINSLHEEAKTKQQNKIIPKKTTYIKTLIGTTLIATIFSFNTKSLEHNISEYIMDNNIDKQIAVVVENLETTIEDRKEKQEERRCKQKKEKSEKTFEKDIDRNVCLLLGNQYNKKRIMKHFSNLSQYEDIIINAAEKTDLKKNYLLSVYASESGGELRAKSKAKAVGPAQFMIPTAIDLGLEVNDFIDERYHPKSLEKGAVYLNKLKRNFGNELLASIAYNWGYGRTKKLIKKHGTNWNDIKDELPTETKNYVIRIFSRKEILDNMQQYEFTYNQKPLFSQKIGNSNNHVVKQGENIYQIRKNYGMTIDSLKELNPEIRDYAKIRPNMKIRVVNGKM